MFGGGEERVERGRNGPGKTRVGEVEACAVVFASGVSRGLGFRVAGFRFKGLGFKVCFRLARPRARDRAKGGWCGGGDIITLFYIAEAR